jgi:hypothetical protein
MRGQKKRAPPSAADRATARWGKIIEQIGLQPE